ncbi:hypothetical protein ACRWE6_27245, partial [Escherichia coli]
QVLRAYIFCGACGNNRTNRGGFQFAAARLPWFRHSDLSHCDFSMTEGLDINPEINRILSIKIPQEAGLKILKRMGVVVGG